MIIFIDLTDKICNGSKEFTFYNTDTDRFVEFSGSQTWSSIEDFKKDFKGSNFELKQYIDLIPKSTECVTVDCARISPISEDTCIDMIISMKQLGKSYKRLTEALGNMYNPNQMEKVLLNSDLLNDTESIYFHINKFDFIKFEVGEADDCLKFLADCCDKLKEEGIEHESLFIPHNFYLYIAFAIIEDDYTVALLDPIEQLYKMGIAVKNVTVYIPDNIKTIVKNYDTSK